MENFAHSIATTLIDRIERQITITHALSAVNLSTESRRTLGDMSIYSVALSALVSSTPERTTPHGVEDLLSASASNAVKTFL